MEGVGRDILVVFVGIQLFFLERNYYKPSYVAI